MLWDALIQAVTFHGDNILLGHLGFVGVFFVVFFDKPDSRVRVC